MSLDAYMERIIIAHTHGEFKNRCTLACPTLC